LVVFVIPIKLVIVNYHYPKVELWLSLSLSHCTYWLKKSSIRKVVVFPQIVFVLSKNF
jgi:hypothetical protein